ncbi:toxic anion resistance protein [Ligilactobacillus murinus]|uniref:Toxic anion resistance protein n=1 Tax=Ligilactobacillus murinus TaxID=1622 RepID=A0AAE6WG13_9LACO|nr:toxic anion resistance protein [Ligilactobacillus murinus]NEF83552.1 toxic anion resistance protein [Ligilactobacillus murinus]NEF85783.1 toxic anion resistance protein [Ligilactobacillus murinus]NEF88110.1 toxic anion resistance protein [Ligilactobacillus murinus]NEF90417.1 toxic anion resistance protein [Ligilactobacillus murinus]NEF92669.1 toxic anion resistance protein [Ligilactobacillus murinus]
MVEKLEVTPASAENDNLNSLKKQLSTAELQKAKDYALTLRDNRQNTITNYGKDVQNEMTKFTDEVLLNVKNKDTGEIGESLRNLVVSLDSADPEKMVNSNRGIRRFFNKLRLSVFEMTAKYQEVSVQIDQVTERLKAQEASLLEDNAILDQMYQVNLDYYKSLNVLIVGGQLRSAEMKNEIEEKQAVLDEQAADQMQYQVLRDLKDQKDRLEQRVNDLLLTREITIQQAPQIKLIQNANSILSEKIHSSINTAIPLWKNQVGIAISLLRQKNALEAQEAVADATNELLKKNSSMLRQQTVDVVKATQRGVVDVETLKATQADLVATLQEVMTVQQEGEQKRKNVQAELDILENNFQAKILANTQNISKSKANEELQ